MKDRPWSEVIRQMRMRLLGDVLDTGESGTQGVLQTNEEESMIIKVYIETKYQVKPGVSRTGLLHRCGEK